MQLKLATLPSDRFHVGFPAQPQYTTFTKPTLEPHASKVAIKARQSLGNLDKMPIETQVPLSFQRSTKPFDLLFVWTEIFDTNDEPANKS